jgi:hypothetical protein
MKTKLLSLAFFAAVLFFSATVSSQNTSGTLNFNFTTLNQGTSKCVMAVWVENSAGLFIKTKIRYLGSGTTDHLPVYGVKSGGSASDAMSGNIVDATTGPTRTSSTTPVAWGPKSLSWNGTNVAGTVVADGVYKVWVEAAWNDGDPDIHDYINTGYSFTKGITINSTIPASDAVLNAMTLVWTPSALSLDNVYKTKVAIYPNPSNGVINVQYNEIPVNKIEVVNVLGQVVKSVKIDSSKSETSQSIDLSGNTNGLYIINVSTNETSSSYKVVLDK